MGEIGCPSCGHTGGGGGTGGTGSSASAPMTSTNTVSIQVTSPCGCPSGSTCPDSLGVCPSGYMPDPNNIGCCIPQCPPQTCPAGQQWSSTTCSCMYIKANSISAPASYKINNGYNMLFNKDQLNEIDALGALGNISACVNYDYGLTATAGNEGNNQVLNTVSVKFSVLDVNGNPIPNVPLTFSNDQLMGNYPITTGNTTGRLSISLSLPAQTDANGNATLTLDLTYQLISWKDKAAFMTITNIQETAFASGNIMVTADNHNTGSVSATLFVSINLIFCETWELSSNPLL